MRTSPFRRFSLAAVFAAARGPKPAATSPGNIAVASERRLRRLSGLALAATLAVLPASVAVQNVDAPKAEAAVDNAHPVVLGAAATAVLNFWLNRWPAPSGGRNAVYRTGAGYVDGGGVYQDRSQNLANYIRRMTGTTMPLTFREYDDTARNNPGTGRNAGRYVWNANYHIIFHTVDQYSNFTPLNFGLSPARFPRTVYCHQHPRGQNNPTRIALHNGHSNVLTGFQTAVGAFGTPGLPGAAMSVDYQRVTEYWDVQGSYHQPAGSRLGGPLGFTFSVYTAVTMNHDANAICRQWTGLQYGSF